MAEIVVQMREKNKEGSKKQEAVGSSCRHRSAKDRICVGSKSLYGRERKLL